MCKGLKKKKCNISTKTSIISEMNMFYQVIERVTTDGHFIFSEGHE